MLCSFCCGRYRPLCSLEAAWQQFMQFPFPLYSTSRTVLACDAQHCLPWLTLCNGTTECCKQIMRGLSRKA